MEVAHSLMLSTFLPSYLWGDVLNATHLINWMPTHVLHLQTPLEYLKESYAQVEVHAKSPDFIESIFFLIFHS